MFRPESTPPIYYLVMPPNRTDQESWISILNGIRTRLRNMTDCMRTLTPRTPHKPRLNMFDVDDIHDNLYQYNETAERVIFPHNRLLEWYENLRQRRLMLPIIKIIDIKGGPDAPEAPPLLWEHSYGVDQTGVSYEGWDMFVSVHTVYVDNAALLSMNDANRTLSRHVYLHACGRCWVCWVAKNQFGTLYSNPSPKPRPRPKQNRYRPFGCKYYGR